MKDWHYTARDMRLQGMHAQDICRELGMSRTAVDTALHRWTNMGVTFPFIPHAERGRIDFERWECNGRNPLGGRLSVGADTKEECLEEFRAMGGKDGVLRKIR